MDDRRSKRQKCKHDHLPGDTREECRALRKKFVRKGMDDSCTEPAVCYWGHTMAYIGSGKVLPGTVFNGKFIFEVKSEVFRFLEPLKGP